MLVWRMKNIFAKIVSMTDRTFRQNNTAGLLSPGLYKQGLIQRATGLIHSGEQKPLWYIAVKNLRAVQLLLGHTRLESTVRYRGIEVDDAWEMTE